MATTLLAILESDSTMAKSGQLTSQVIMEFANQMNPKTFHIKWFKLTQRELIKLTFNK